MKKIRYLLLAIPTPNIQSFSSNTLACLFQGSTNELFNQSFVTIKYLANLKLFTYNTNLSIKKTTETSYIYQQHNSIPLLHFHNFLVPMN